MWWVAFDPALGSEIRKTRPAVIVSNDKANAKLSRVQVIPLTLNVTRLYPGDTFVALQGEQRRASANQIRTVAVERLGRFIEALATTDMAAVDRGLRVQLDLPA